MGDKTGISWTDATWNPIRGCTRVSAGCVNCYAEKVAARFAGPGLPYEGTIDEHGRWNGQIRLVPEMLPQPLRWQRPRRIFVNSMSDLAHGGVPESYVAAVFGVMAAAPRHSFQVLTKRPDRLAELVAKMGDGRLSPEREAIAYLDELGFNRSLFQFDRELMLPNVWLGASVEEQRVAHRIDELRATPAAVRFLSIEPMIGPVEADLTGIDWIILGGESGPGARPCDPEWFRPLIAEARRVGAAVWVKQLGSVWAAAHPGDRKGGVPDEWPVDLQIQEFPR